MTYSLLRNNYIYSVISAIIGVLLSIFWYLSINKESIVEQQNNMTHLGTIVENELQYQIDVNLSNLDALKAFYEGSNFVDEDEFNTFTSSLSKNYDSLSGLIWAKNIHVPPNQSLSKIFIENKIPFKQSYDLTKNNELKLIPDQTDSPRTIYPITYYFGDSKLKLVSINIASESRRLAALEKSIKTQKSSSTELLKLVQRGNKDGFIVYDPVYKKIKGSVNIDGFVGAIYDLEQIYKSLRNNLGHNSDYVKVSLIDPNTLQSVWDKINLGDLFEKSTQDNHLSYTGNIQLPNNQLTLIVQPTNAFMSLNTHQKPTFYLFTGLGLTALVTILIHSVFNLFQMRKRADKAAKQLAELNNLLEQKVKERTAQLEFQNSELQKTKDELSKSNTEINKRLMQLSESQKKLEESQDQLIQIQKMDSLGKLAGGVAHDFNNFLAGIMGYASLLKKKLDKQPDLVKYTDSIIKSAETSAGLTKQLLGFARKGQYEKNYFNMNTIIQDVIAMIKRPMTNHINIVTNFQDDIWLCRGDTQQWHQVIMNLLVNAMDAMPLEGAITIKTENTILSLDDLLKLKFNDSTCIKISIQDTGAGIPESIRHKIFDPFFTTKEVGKGTGLGLSMVYGIVENHRGRILVDSKENRGTVFTIYLPTNGVTQKSEIQQSREITSNKTDNLTALNILGVDDNPDMRDILSLILDDLQIGNQMVSDGKTFLKCYSENVRAYDFVLLDIIMPEMDGFAIYEEIQKLNPNQKVIFISGFSETEKMQEIRTNPLVRYISKPFSSSQIISLIHSYSIKEEAETLQP